LFCLSYGSFHTLHFSINSSLLFPFQILSIYIYMALQPSEP
jgi:hypothetical protein